MKSDSDTSTNITRSSKKMMKTKTKKKKKTTRIIRGILNYLKSDTYLYSPLFFFFSNLNSSSPDRGLMENREELGVLKSEGNLRKKALEYLKSDTYLYAPYPAEYTYTYATLPCSSPIPKGDELKKVYEAKTKRVAEQQGQKKPRNESIPGIDHLSPTTPQLVEFKSKRKVIRFSRSISGQQTSGIP